MKRLTVLLVSLLLAVPGQIWAQDTAKAKDSSSTATMEDMVVTATRTEEPLKDIPGRIEVITRAQLKEMPAETVDQALSYISGVHQERSYGLTSHSTTVSLRGMGNQQGRTLVLVDGVPQNTADMGSVNWNRLNLEDVQRIEVLKGPAAAIYGDNAMGGVINIITVKPTKFFQGSTTGSYGTNADWKFRAVVAGRTSEDKTGLYARVSALTHSNRGYVNVPSEQRDIFTRKSFIDQKTMNAKLGYDFTPTTNLEFQYTKDKQIMGEGEEMFAYLGKQRGYESDIWQGRFNFGYEQWSGMVNAYFSDVHYARVMEKMKSYKIANYSRTDVLVNRRNYGILTNLSKVWGPNKFTVGFDYKVGVMDGTDYARTPPYTFATDYGKLRNLGVFGQDQIKLLDDTLIFLAGLRYDSATTYDGHYDTNSTTKSLYRYTQEYSDHTWDDWSPRISVKYFFLPNWSAYASYGHAFRAPILDDMYRTGMMMGAIKVSNPYLGPERSDSFEIGSDYQPADNLKFSGSGYYSQVYDYMGTVTVGYDSVARMPLKQSQNIGEVHIWGFELNAEYSPFKHQDIDLLRNFKLFGNYTFNESRVIRSSELPTLEGKLVPYTPQNTFNVGFNWLNKYINNRSVLQYIGTMYSDETNTTYNKIDPHAVINTKFWRNFDFLGPYGKNFVASLTIEDLLDSRYYVRRSNNVSSSGVSASENYNEGRTMYLELTCKF